MIFLSFFLFVLGNEKGKTILYDELIVASCSPLTSPPVLPLILNH